MRPDTDRLPTLLTLADLSRGVRERSGGRCECRGECGRDHAEERLAVARADPRPGALQLVPIRSADRCVARQGRGHPFLDGLRAVLAVVVLTADSADPGNGAFREMCQRCREVTDAWQLGPGPPSASPGTDPGPLEAAIPAAATHETQQFSTTAFPHHAHRGARS
jgi:hypothetical protein